MKYEDEIGKTFRELKRKQQELAKPSEPRRHKRQSNNPMKNRPGRGQTTAYRANKVAEQTLKTTFVSRSHPSRRPVEPENRDPYWAGHFSYWR